MSLLDDIEEQLRNISPAPWRVVDCFDNFGILSADVRVATLDWPEGLHPTGTNTVAANVNFIAAAPERIKLLVDFAKASLALVRERGGLELSEYQSEAGQNFIAARRALKVG